SNLMAYVSGGSVISQNGVIQISAATTATITTLSAGISGGGTASITGAISLNKITDIIDAHVSGSANVTGNNNVEITATEAATISSLSGQGAGGESGGIGGAAAYNDISATVRAYIDGASVT